MTAPHDQSDNQPGGGAWAAPESPPTLPTTPTNGPSAPPTTRPDLSTSDNVEPPRRSGRRWGILAAAAAGLVVVGGALAVGLRGSGETAGDRAGNDQARIAPETIEPKFELDTRGRVFGEYGRLTAEVDDGERIAQYDESGGERWSFDVPSDWDALFVGSEVGGRIPLHIRNGDREPELFIGFLDAETGDLTDTEIDLSDGEGEFAGWPFAGHLPVWSDHSLELYDPTTGELQAEVRADVVQLAPWADAIFAVDDYELSVFDLDLQPIVTDFPIDDETARITVDVGSVPEYDVVGGRLITIDGSQIVGNDDSGVAWTIDPGMGELIDARSIGDDGWLLRLATGDMAIVNNTDGDEFEEVWRGSELGSPERIGDDHVLFAAANLLLVSAKGDELYEADDVESWSHVVVDNGFLVGRKNGDDTEVTFVDLGGVERWSIEIGIQIFGLDVADNVVFDPDAGVVYGPE